MSKVNEREDDAKTHTVGFSAFWRQRYRNPRFWSTWVFEGAIVGQLGVWLYRVSTSLWLWKNGSLSIEWEYLQEDGG